MLKLLLFLICLSGCASHTILISPEIRTKNADALAKTVNWHTCFIHTSKFTLKSYGSDVYKNSDKLFIYIEGDGLAWLAEDLPSNNPTPMTPISLQLAIRAKNYPIAYLARPCQFVFNHNLRGCKREYWTNLRFSPEVLNSMNQAVDYLKKYYHAKQIILIGYSGGGTIATLLASMRKDVVKLITVAAILDTDYWVHKERLTPLTGSLNPADRWKDLVSISQIHWVGGKDTVVSQDVASAFAKRFAQTQKLKIKVMPKFDHVCCWEKLKLG